MHAGCCWLLRQLTFMRARTCSCWHRLGNDAKAKQFIDQAVRIAEKVRGRDDASLGPLLRSSASTLVRLGRNKEALAHAERAVAIMDKVAQSCLCQCAGTHGCCGVGFMQTLGADHVESAETRSVLGRIYFDCEMMTKAQHVLEPALKLLVAVRGETHSMVAKTVESLALVYGEQGDWEKGQASVRACLTHTPPAPPAEKEMLTRSVNINKALYGPKHPQTALGSINLANCLGNLGDLSGKRQLLEEVRNPTRAVAIGR